MPVGLHAAIQFHVRCNLRAFRLTKSITQSCGACASQPHNTHCFFLSLLDGPNTNLLITEEWSYISHTVYSTFEQSSEVKHELL